MKKQSSENKFIITEEFISDQNKLSYDLNIHFKQRSDKALFGDYGHFLNVSSYLVRVTILELLLRDEVLVNLSSWYSVVAGLIPNPQSHCCAVFWMKLEAYLFSVENDILPVTRCVEEQNSANSLRS